jgi:hypothetical protein
MKRIFTSVLAALGIGTSAEGSPPQAGVMAELRAKALAVKPADLGLASSEYANAVWGVLMETGAKEGAAYTLVVLADGSTSLYFSTGGGIIGAGEYASVRAAGVTLIREASQMRTEAAPTATTPLPATGQVVFYLLSGGGTLRYSAPEQELGEGKNPFSNLFYSAHAVITEVRKYEEQLPHSPK